jgi:hypothetical protein
MKSFSCLMSFHQIYKSNHVLLKMNFKYFSIKRVLLKTMSIKTQNYFNTLSLTLADLVLKKWTLLKKIETINS